MMDKKSIVNQMTGPESLSLVLINIEHGQVRRIKLLLLKGRQVKRTDQKDVDSLQRMMDT